MELFFRNKLNIVLWVIAFIMVIVLVIYLVAAARFLVDTGRAAFGGSLIKSVKIVTFNVAKAAQLRQLRGIR